MPRKENFLPFFLVFFSLSILIILLGTTGLLGGITGIIGRGANPITSTVFSILTLPALKNKAIADLSSENQNLRGRDVEIQNLKSENKALKDQFEISGADSLNLLPAKIIAAPGFIPGESEPTYLVIDKGSSDGLRKGSVVISGKNLVGSVVELTDVSSKIQLVVSSGSSFTAKTGSPEIDGVAKGKGSSILLDNVLLSQNLKKDDLVLTKGDNLFPPDFVVGKIISIEKRPSDLFQKAQVQSLVNLHDLVEVFVIK